MKITEWDKFRYLAKNFIHFSKLRVKVVKKSVIHKQNWPFYWLWWTTDLKMVQLMYFTPTVNYWLKQRLVKSRSNEVNLTGRKIELLILALSLIQMTLSRLLYTGLAPCKTKWNLQCFSKFNHYTVRWFQVSFRSFRGDWWLGDVQWFIRYFSDLSDFQKVIKHQQVASTPKTRTLAWNRLFWLKF